MSKEKLLDSIIERGYDAFVDGDLIIILKDGFTSKSSLSSSLNLMSPQMVELENGEEIEFSGVELKDVVDIIITHHNTAKDIKDGVYNDIKPMSIDETVEFFNKIYRDLNKDDWNKRH